MEGAQGEDAQVNGHDPDCEEILDDPHTSFEHQLEVVKRSLKACDSCLSNVQRAATHCRTCDAFFCESHLADHDKAPASSSHETVTEEAPRPPVNEDHLQFNPPAPALVNTYSISWQWLMVILIVLLAVMIPMYSKDREHARAAVQGERVQAKLEEMRGCCQRLNEAVEDERGRITEYLCAMQEELEAKRSTMRRQLQEQRQMLLEVFQEEDLKPFASFVMPLVDSTNAILEKLLESHQYSDDVKCLRSGVPNASTAQAL